MSLSEFHKWVKDVVRSACEEALIVEDFVPDPFFDEKEGISHTPHCILYKKSATTSSINVWPVYNEWDPM